MSVITTQRYLKIVLQNYITYPICSFVLMPIIETIESESEEEFETGILSGWSVRTCRSRRGNTPKAGDTPPLVIGARSTRRQLRGEWFSSDAKFVLWHDNANDDGTMNVIVYQENGEISKLNCIIFEKIPTHKKEYAWFWGENYIMCVTGPTNLTWMPIDSQSKPHYHWSREQPPKREKEQPLKRVASARLGSTVSISTRNETVPSIEKWATRCTIKDRVLNLDMLGRLVDTEVEPFVAWLKNFVQNANQPQENLWIKADFAENNTLNQESLEVLFAALYSISPKIFYLSLHHNLMTDEKNVVEEFILKIGDYIEQIHLSHNKLSFDTVSNICMWSIQLPLDRRIWARLGGNLNKTDTVKLAELLYPHRHLFCYGNNCCVSKCVTGCWKCFPHTFPSATQEMYFPAIETPTSSAPSHQTPNVSLQTTCSKIPATKVIEAKHPPPCYRPNSGTSATVPTTNVLVKSPKDAEKKEQERSPPPPPPKARPRQAANEPILTGGAPAIAATTPATDESNTVKPPPPPPKSKSKMTTSTPLSTIASSSSAPPPPPPPPAKSRTIVPEFLQTHVSSTPSPAPPSPT